MVAQSAPFCAHLLDRDRTRGTNPPTFSQGLPVPGTCVIGLQWGDEAKGKVVDLLTPRHEIVVRYQGGANAGHTVVKNVQKYKLSLIPSGILSPDVKCVVTAGVVVNPAKIL